MTGRLLGNHSYFKIDCLKRFIWPPAAKEMIMTDSNNDNLISLDMDLPIWNRFFKVSSLVLIGTRDENGEYNQAPKHMAIPMGWEDFFGFVCTAAHTTYHNIVREAVFTATCPRPTQITFTSLAAAPRGDDNFKPSLTSLPTFQAESIDGRFVSDGYAFLECERHKIVDGLGQNSLIMGKVIAANIHRDRLQISDEDDGELIRKSPILAYLEPERFARIESNFSFPMPRGFSR